MSDLPRNEKKLFEPLEGHLGAEMDFASKLGDDIAEGGRSFSRKARATLRLPN